jgi:RsiW-degrading membrane proteinase PrsW (M82 family)
MMSHWWLYGIASIPSLIICYWIFRIDKYEKEPAWALSLTFLTGALATIPGVEVQKSAYEFFREESILHTFFLAFIAIAANEEIWKLLVVVACALPWRFFNEPMDGLVYAVFASMGFAAAENLAYAQRLGIETAILRAFTAVPAHLLFAIIIGYYAGRAKFEPTVVACKLLLRGLFFATLLHGTYDMLLLQKLTDWLVAFAPIAVYIGLYYSSSLLRMHQEQSPFRPKTPAEL